MTRERAFFGVVSMELVVAYSNWWLGLLYLDNDIIFGLNFLITEFIIVVVTLKLNITNLTLFAYWVLARSFMRLFSIVVVLA